jgi:hypothetical protein
MNINDLIAIEAEVRRFMGKLQAAKIRIKTDATVEFSGCKETGAVKRAALDLKNELTRITK